MSLLSRAISAFAPAAPAAVLVSQQFSSDMAKILDDFRQKRADDIAELADRAGRSGAQLAQAKIEADHWKAYARDLERICLAHGLEMPAAPDEA